MKQLDAFSTESSCWEALVQRNSEADGLFVCGVLTTGIYCRPCCPSRLPNRENVRFFNTWWQAEQAGFRPCKRCTPQLFNKPETSVKAIIQACKMIEEAEQPPSLRQLADAAGLSPYYFHRLFKKIVGVTPKQYATQEKVERVRGNLQQGTTVTEAIYNAGYEASSRFYETSTASLGMNPSIYRHGGRGVSIRYATVQSYLGWVLVGATEKGICKIDFGNTPEILQANLKADFPQAELQDNDPNFNAIVAKVLALIESPHQGLELPLDIQGTAFQRRVWLALQDIPSGSTASYTEIAARIGNPKAARAVAQACASNHLAIAVPCHRVVRSNGDLGGYRWGIDRKRAILAREANTKNLMTLRR